MHHFLPALLIVWHGAPGDNEDTNKIHLSQGDTDMTNVNEIKTAELDQVAGGGFYDDEPAEVIFEEAYKTAAEWKKSGRPLDTALEMLTRYFCVPGRVERQQLFPVVYSAYEEN